MTPNVQFNDDSSKNVTDKVMQQKYMQKIVGKRMMALIEEYYLSLGAFVFEEEFNDSDAMGKSDYVKNKIILMKKAQLLSKYWSSPIASMSEDNVLKVSQSRNTTDFITGSRSASYQVIKDVFEGNGENKLSLTPYIYEPMNEFQMAKYVHMISDPSIINLLLQTTDDNSTAMGMQKPPSVVKTLSPGMSSNIYSLINASPFTSLVDKVKVGGSEIYPLVNNIKRNSNYNND